MTNHKPIGQKSFFKDKDGRTILWQWPNMPLYGWIIFKVLSLVIAKGNLQTGFKQLSMAFLFTWAYLEITDGVNYFRKLLGLLVLIALIIGYFK